MTITDSARVELARECLTLISSIAERGALTYDPEQVSYALEELSQVLFERSGSEEILFEPSGPHVVGDLNKLLGELRFVDDIMPRPRGN